MGKLLLLVAVLFAVVAVLRVFARQRRGHRRASTPEGKPNSTAKRVQSLLACPQCGVHMAHNELAVHVASHSQTH
jgi:hypothetical protein